jgi:cobalt-zinc-cadmium efflux system outer membrane protein
VGPYLSREEAGEAETTVGLAVSMPLSWSSRNQGAIQAAQARREKAEAELKAETTGRPQRAGPAGTPLRGRGCAGGGGAGRALVESLHEAADLADRQYRLGAIPVQLFLDMQREFLSVQLLRHNAQLESLKMAAELEWLAGSAAGETAP